MSTLEEGTPPFFFLGACVGFQWGTQRHWSSILRHRVPIAVRGGAVKMHTCTQRAAGDSFLLAKNM